MSKMNKKLKLILLLLLGIFIGVWALLSLGTLVVSISLLLISFILYRYIPKSDRTFILWIILIAFILRVILLFFYYDLHLLQGKPDILGPDGETYSQRGWYISRLMLEENPYRIPDNREYAFNYYGFIIEHYDQELPPIGEYQVGLYSYLIGILYTIFSYSPLMIKLINSVLSILTGVTAYFIGKEIFNSSVGKVAFTLLVFLPSTLIFSVTSLKDTSVIFLLTALIWLMIKFQKSKNFLLLLLVMITVLMIQLLRIPLRYPLLIFIVLTLLLSLKISVLKKCFIIILTVIVIFSIPATQRIIKKYLELDTLFSLHIGYINTPGNNYRLFPASSYYSSHLIGVGPLEIAGAIIKGIFHLLAEPLPHRIKNKNLLFAFPQTILLYLFIPFIIIGTIIGLKKKHKEMIPIAVYLILFVPIIAIGSGNVGTVFRHRDMFMPFFIILGVAGCYALFQRKYFPPSK